MKASTKALFDLMTVEELQKAADSAQALLGGALDATGTFAANLTDNDLHEVLEYSRGRGVIPSGNAAQNARVAEEAIITGEVEVRSGFPGLASNPQLNLHPSIAPYLRRRG